MPALQNPKHERLAQEIANGLDQADAYMAATGGQNRNSAGAAVSRLLASVKGATVKSRAAEILAEREAIHSQATAKAIEAEAITKIGHLETLAMLRDQAAAADQFGAAVSAEVSRGKVAGFYVDRKEIRTGLLDDRSNDELRAIEAALAGDEGGDASGDQAASVH